MGAGLSGLTTAFRLVSHGFQVSIVDQSQIHPSTRLTAALPPDTPSDKTLHSLDRTENTFDHVHSMPLVIHGFQHATWSLLRELQPLSHLTSLPSVTLEFMTRTRQSAPFKPLWAPTPFHTLIGLLRFQGMSLTERWILLKKLEQYWEGDLEVPPDLKNQSVQTWLSTLEQSEHTIQNIWNPLCHFFLGSDATHSSAEYFKTLLVQYFLSAREQNRTVISPLDEESLFLTPLRKSLAAQHITFHEHAAVTHFQYDARGLTGVKLHDGTTLTANFYVSAFPREKLIACLSDRILTKYAYFSNLAQLQEFSKLVTHLEIPDPTTKARLLLFPSTFNWIAIQPLRHLLGRTSNGTRVSCVTTSEQPANEKSDHDTLSALSNMLPPPLNQHIHVSSSTSIIQHTRTFTPCQPETSVFRPIQKSPLSNFFLVGPWTDTGSPPSHESSIISANLCTQSVLDSIAQR
ncbi:MAG: hypothetical protein NPIRA04_12840 [Nitrospirales bacterium]|nr:MAG: hypothetical protein NPIRA04_12840 [Nitrospirales bacterium]